MFLPFGQKTESPGASILQTPSYMQWGQRSFISTKDTDRRPALRFMPQGWRKVYLLLSPSSNPLELSCFYSERSCPAISIPSTNSEVEPSSHQSKWSKTSGVQAMRRPPSQQKPNSSSDFANRARNTLLVRYEVGITNLRRSGPTYTARQPHGTSAGGHEDSTSLS